MQKPGFDPWVRKIPWRRKWQPTPVLLPGKSHGQRSLVDYSSWISKSWTRLSDFTFFHFHGPNIGAAQYIRQTLTDIKGEIDRNTIIVDLNTPLTPVNRSSKHKSNNQTRLKWYIRCDGSHWHLQAIPSKCRRIHFLSAHGTFSRIDHILGHKSNFSKFKKIEIVSSILFNHNALRFDINYKEKKL